MLTCRITTACGRHARRRRVSGKRTFFVNVVLYYCIVQATLTSIATAVSPWLLANVRQGSSTTPPFAVLTDDINSNLNAARAFTIFWFLAALVVVAGSINAWRSAGAHPHPKVTFISALVAAFCTIISMGAYANWFHQQIVSDVQQVGNNPTSSYMGSKSSPRHACPARSTAYPLQASSSLCCRSSCMRVLPWPSTWASASLVCSATACLARTHSWWKTAPPPLLQARPRTRVWQVEQYDAMNQLRTMCLLGCACVLFSNHPQPSPLHCQHSPHKLP